MDGVTEFDSEACRSMRPGENCGGEEALMTGVTVVVPVYNSEQSLSPLVTRIESVLGSRDLSFEILLVNDGSTDGSWAVIESLAGRHRSVVGVELRRNYGQHNALLCGWRLARYAVCVTIDDDLQNPPEEIPQLLEALTADHDVVYGVPYRQKHTFFRLMASKVTKFVLRHAMGAEAAGAVSSFRAFRTQLRNAISEYHSPHVCIDVMLTWTTRRFQSVSVEHRERESGKSTYTASKLFAHALNMLTGYSTTLLRLASMLGFICAFFGLSILGYVLVRFALIGSPVPGFPFLASIIAIFSGAQLVSLGIIGEYLARMHFRLMDRPVYSVRRVTVEVCDDAG